MNDLKELKFIEKEKFFEYFCSLARKAFEKNAFDTICSLLRVGGCQDADWDSFEESQKSFEDYNWLLKKAKDAPSKNGHWRIGLLIYCQAIEMTAPHELLTNILRIIAGEHYHIRPFGHLSRSNKKQILGYIPPSAKRKIDYIKELATKTKETLLIEYFDSFFNNKVRNSFFHSDYIFSSEYYRWTEGGPAQQIPLEEISVLISNCFNFYGALISWHKEYLNFCGKAKKFHKWPQYEILELLNNEEKGLYGFSVHFSNGSKATYSRTDKGTDCINLHFEKNGSINFNCGLIDALEPVWKINGVPIEQIENLNL